MYVYILEYYVTNILTTLLLLHIFYYGVIYVLYVVYVFEKYILFLFNYY